MMDTHTQSAFDNDYDPIPEPPKTGVQVAIILCAILVGVIAIYKMTTGHW